MISPIKIGASWLLIGEWTDAMGAALPLFGINVIAAMASDTGCRLQLQTEIINPAAGTFLLTATASATAELKPGRYYLDVVINDGVTLTPAPSSQNLAVDVIRSPSVTGRTV